MASGMTRSEMIRAVKVLFGTSGVVYVLAQFAPDFKSPAFRSYEIKEYEKDIEKALAIHRERKRKESTSI